MIRACDRCLLSAMDGQHDLGICANAEDTSTRGTQTMEQVRHLSPQPMCLRSLMRHWEMSMWTRQNANLVQPISDFAKLQIPSYNTACCALSSAVDSVSFPSSCRVKFPLKKDCDKSHSAKVAVGQQHRKLLLSQRADVVDVWVYLTIAAESIPLLVLNWCCAFQRK